MKSPRWIWQHRGWPRLEVDAATIAPAVARARRAQGILLGKAQALGLSGMQDALLDIWAREAEATARIEGEALDLQALRSSVAKRLGIVVTGRFQRNVEGLIDVMADATLNRDAPLTVDRLCGWQAALSPSGFSSVRKIRVGRFRTHAAPMQVVSGAVGRERLHFEAPPSSRMRSELSKFVRWFESMRKDSLDGIARAAVAHLWFETIHPFEDGNGRVGRAIIDLALAQDADMDARLYSMSGRLEKNRDDYYIELERAQCGGLDVTAWALWFIGQFGDACEASGTVIDVSLDRARFWTRHRETSLNHRQRKAVNLLLEAGPHGFEGGLNTRKYVSVTKASRATAFRELGALVRAGLLMQVGQGRATRYYPKIDGWYVDGEG